MNIFVWGNTRLIIRQVVEATRNRLIYIDQDGNRRVRFKPLRIRQPVAAERRAA